VFVDDRLVLGEVDAKGLVGGDEGLDPLDVGAEFAQRAIRCLRRSLQLVSAQAADRRDVPLDDVFPLDFFLSWDLSISDQRDRA
jgi:hypothetical protein